MQLELDLSLEISVGLGNDFALDVVGSKDWLLQFDVAKSNEGETEALERGAALLVVKDHPVRRQIQPSGIVATFQFGHRGSVTLAPTREVHRHIVAKQENTFPRM